jgi:hypothetical protein
LTPTSHSDGRHGPLIWHHHPNTPSSNGAVGLVIPENVWERDYHNGSLKGYRAETAMVHCDSGYTGSDYGVLAVSLIFKHLGCNIYFLYHRNSQDRFRIRIRMAHTHELDTLR